MKHQAIVGNIGHFDNEINMAGLARSRASSRDEIKPQVHQWIFPDGKSSSSVGGPASTSAMRRATRRS